MQHKVTRLRPGDRVRVGLHTEVHVLEITPGGRVLLRWSSEADAISLLDPAPTREPKRPWRRTDN